MKKFLNKRGQCSVLYHYLITYFIVFLIPILICCGFFVYLISSISKDVILHKKNELKQTSVLIDTMIEEFTYFGDSIVSNIEVNSFKHETKVFNYPNNYKIIEVKKELPNVFRANQSIFDYFVFFNESEIMVNNQAAYKYEDFYSLYLREADSTSYEDWYKSMKDKQHSKRVVPMKTYLYKDESYTDLIIYKQPLLSSSANIDYGEVWIAIEDTVLEAQMPPMVESSAQYITDSHGNILYSKVSGDNLLGFNAGKGQSNLLKADNDKKSFKINGERYQLIEYKSEQTGLSFIVIQPQKALNQQKLSTITIMMVIISIAVAAGMALSYYMSQKSATPISDILKEVDRTIDYSQGSHKSFDNLRSVFRELVKTNSNMEEAIENQKPFIKNNFVNRLIYGDFMSKDEVAKIASFIELEDNDQVYGVVIFRLLLDDNIFSTDNNKMQKFYMISLEEVIKSYMPGSLYANNGDEQLVVLINLPLQKREDFQKIIEKKVENIISKIPASISNKLYVFGGSEVYELSDISESYQNAVYMFRHKSEWVNDGVIWYSTKNEELPNYPPLDFSMKLTHYTISGDEKKLRDELGKIMKSYILNNNLPLYLQRLLLNELQIVIFRTLGRIEIEEKEYRKYYDVLEKNQNGSLLEQICTTLNIFQEVCHCVAEKNQSMNCESLIDSIKGYIDENYTDDSLSLTSVADTFNISEPYLSSVFKDCMDINFSSYVEQVRTDKAKELLVTTTMTITEIAKKVGYCSVNSFSRAFKRVVGVTASSYRLKLNRS